MTAPDLANLAEQLLDLATAEQRPAVQSVLDRARAQRLRVLVVGEAKRGKSTLINRLLERDLLPTGVVPVTAIPTVVRSGERDELRIRFLDGREEIHDLRELARFVTERENPANRLAVAAADVVLRDGPLARHRVELVDTPGIGSVFEHNTQTAEDAYADLDAVIVVVTATPPMNAAERELLAEVSGTAVRTFIVVNKSDQLTPAELAETVEFTAGVCVDVGVRTERIFPMSARDTDAGLADFRAQFDSYLAELGAQDLDRALRGHVRRLAHGLRGEAAVELRAFELARGEHRARVDAFAALLDSLADQAAELADRCHASERRLRRELDHDAHLMTRDLVGYCHRQLDATLGDAVATLAADELERRAHAQIEEVIAESVLRWRDEQARDLERRVAQLIAGVQLDRDQQLTSLHEAAASELGVTLGASAEPLPLDPGRLFWLDFAPPPAVELPGSQVLRRHGPRAAERAWQRVLRIVPEVADRQVGRARADLQQRLAETMRRVVARLQTEHAETLTRLGHALTRATHSRDQDEPRTQHELAHLQRRIEEIDRLIPALGGREDDPAASDTA